MYTLYMLSGSAHSQQAKSLLDTAKIEFRPESVSESDQLSAIFYDLGIRELPALVLGSTMAEGLENIKAFIQTKTAP